MRCVLCCAALLVLFAGCDDGAGPGLDAFCHGQPDGQACDDGNPCTQGDICGGGACLGRAVDDGRSCDDGDGCTDGDHCIAGACQGRLRDCSVLDGPCGVGACVPSDGRCRFQPLADGQACDDRSACTIGDACRAGTCVGDRVTCAEPGPCEIARCDPAIGCAVDPAPDGIVCDDGLACTDGDRCRLGTCVSGPDACVCDGAPEGLPCDDGDACTLNDACRDGACRGEMLACPEGDICQRGVCDPLSGECVMSPAADGTPCDAEDACVAEAMCTAGACVGANTCGCDGRPDGVACDDGRGCTTDDVCASGRCVGEPVDCGELSSQCAVGRCDDATGRCVAEPRPRGTRCDDGDACTIGDACQLDACVGEPMDCAALDAECEVGRCDPDIGACVTVERPDESPCDDSDACTGADRCVGGVCAGPLALCAACEGLAAGDRCDDSDACTADTRCAVVGAGRVACQGRRRACGDFACELGVCDPDSGACLQVQRLDGVACDDGDACSSGEACRAGECAGGRPTVCAPDACNAAECDPRSGGCRSIPVADGLPCDDGDPRTEDDACAAGICVGQRIETCVGQPDDAPCDDGLRCTEGDRCVAERCVGQPRVCPRQGDAACQRGACDPATGACVDRPEPDGEACDDDDACTVDDTCEGGACVGVALDCSARDGACVAGRCEGGACVAEAASEGARCDDGDGCSGADRCAGGVCAGGRALCAPCAGLEAGDRCEDGDACTERSTCVQTAQGLACVGVAMDCSHLTGGCVEGVCDAGACTTIPKRDGTACDDRLSCTTGDVCDAGECAGQVRACLGVPNDRCEAPQVDEVVDLATPVAAQTTIAGRIDPPGSQDWYAVPLRAGDHLAVRTSPVCESRLDTVLGIYDRDGERLLRFADDVAEGANPLWAAISGHVVLATGTYFLAVSAFADSGAGDYLLTVDAGPPPCAVHADCGCGELHCEVDRCRPRDAEEIEPAAARASHGELRPERGAPASLVGWLDERGDWFDVPLAAGQAVTLETTGFCGGRVDPRLTLYDPERAEILADDRDGAGGGHARIEQFVPPADGFYKLRVLPEGGLFERYRVTARDVGCAVDADCGCGDAICVETLCAPAVPQAPALGVGTRMHGRLAGPDAPALFTVDLAAGTYTLATDAWCGPPLDTRIRLLDAAGVLIAENDDAFDDGAGLSALERALPAGRYLIEVAAESPGDFVISVTR